MKDLTDAKDRRHTEVLRSAIWPDITATIWPVGKIWLCRCESDKFPQTAKTDTFRSRDAALEHAFIVLGRVAVLPT